MSWSGWYLRNSSISANLRSVIGVATPFRLLVVLLLEGNAPVTFSVNHRPDSTGFYTLPGTLTAAGDHGAGWAGPGLRRRASGIGSGGARLHRPSHCSPYGKRIVPYPVCLPLRGRTRPGGGLCPAGLERLRRLGPGLGHGAQNNGLALARQFTG